MEIGDYRAAKETLERAERSGAYNFQGINLIYDVTARTWLEMGEIGRALEAARNASSKSGIAAIKIDAAKALIAAGDKDKALLVLDEALADIHSYLNTGTQTFFSPMAGLRSILNLRQDAGDDVGARALAEEMTTVAKRPSLFAAGELVLAAAGYNDLGARERAADLLRQAMTKLPGANEVIGFGVTLGPITGSTLGVGDGIRSQIAVELYRARDRKAFDAVLQQVSSEYEPVLGPIFTRRPAATERLNLRASKSLMSCPQGRN